MSVADRVAALAADLRRELPGVVDSLHRGLLEAMPEIADDQLIADLLRDSVEGNLDTVAHMLHQGLGAGDVSAPPAASEFARRLAQRGLPPNVFVRAYRLGQFHILEWAYDRILQDDVPPDQALPTYQAVVRSTFQDVEHVAELLIGIYDEEREAWLTQRNTARAAAVDELLSGEAVDVGAAEIALGHRLSHHHVGVVIWHSDPAVGAADPAAGPRLLQSVMDSLDSIGKPLTLPHDRASVWAWIPMGSDDVDLASLLVRVGRGQDELRVALGRPAHGPDGFRATWQDARRAQDVAIIAGEQAPPVISYSDPEVRTAALLARDLDATRDGGRRAR